MRNYLVFLFLTPWASAQVPAESHVTDVVMHSMAKVHPDFEDILINEKSEPVLTVGAITNVLPKLEWFRSKGSIPVEIKGTNFSLERGKRTGLHEIIRSTDPSAIAAGDTPPTLTGIELREIGARIRQIHVRLFFEQNGKSTDRTILINRGQTVTITFGRKQTIVEPFIHGPHALPFVSYILLVTPVIPLEILDLEKPVPAKFRVDAPALVHPGPKTSQGPADKNR